MARSDTEQLVVQLEARIRDFEKNMAKANATAQKNFGQIERRSKQASDRVHRHMTAATAGVTAFSNSLKGLAAGFVGGFGISALQRLVTDSLNAADSIGEMAQVTNVSTRFLQEMRFAAQLSGVEMNGLDDSLRRLTRRIGLFIADGGGPAAKALERLGLASQITSGELRGTEPIFNAVVAALQGVESQAERAALASQLFGDDFGPKLVPLLDQGTEGIAKLREEANRLGIVLSDELIEKAAKANDELDRMAFILRAKTTVSVAGFSEEIVGLTSSFTDFIDAASPFIDFFLSDLESGFKRLSALAKILQGDFSSLGDLLANPISPLISPRSDNPLEVDIRDDDIPGRNPRPPSGVVGSAPRIIPPSPARPALQGPPAPGTPEAAVFEEIARGKEMIAAAEKKAADETERNARAHELLISKQRAAEQAAQQFALTVSGGLSRAILGAESFGDAMRGVIQQLAEAIIQAIIFRSITGAVGGFGTGGEAGTGLLGLFAGGFATGGTIPAGKWGIVGERGPEPVFGPATVLPNKAGMPVQSVAISNTVNVNVEGGSRGEEADRELAGQIGAEVERALDQRITENIRNQMRSGNLLNPIQSSL